MIDADEEIQINLPWKIICKLACQSLILGVSFEELVQKIIGAGLNKETS